MEQNKQPRTWVSFRVKPEEYEIIYNLFQTSACTKFSDYARRTLLQKPVIIRHRNQSADELLSVLIKIKNELNAIGNNLNQSVRKLQTMTSVAEIRTWVILHDAGRLSFLSKAEEIKQALIKISEQWSQE